MSKYNKQNRLDEKAVSVISDYFMNKHGDRFDLQFHGIKDNTPDTDGFLRLREPDTNGGMKGKYLSNIVFFQLKGFEKKIENSSYRSNRTLVDFCKDINLPTILFVVSNISEESDKQGEAQIYWYHFSNVNIEILDKMNKPNSVTVKIPNLLPLKVGKSDLIDQFYLHVKNLAKKNEFLDLPKEILNIAVNLKDQVLQIASIIYLVGRVTKIERQAIAKMLKITDQQMVYILSDLHQQGLIYKDKDVYIFKLASDELKKDIGLSLLYETINKIDLGKLLNLFKEHKQRQLFYKNLAEVRHPVVFDFLNEEADKVLAYVKE